MKKVLALLLLAVILIGSLPLNAAFAAEEEDISFYINTDDNNYLAVLRDDLPAVETWYLGVSTKELGKGYFQLHKKGAWTDLNVKWFENATTGLL